jgi:hypothetical protein
MRKIFWLRILMVSLIIGLNGTLNFSQNKMPADANKVYQDLSTAITTSDSGALRKVLCRTSFVKMINESISIGMEYPGEVMTGMQMALIDFSQLKYIKYNKNGNTINAYYIYMVDNVETSIITLRMVEEDGKLKMIDLRNKDAKDYVINLHKKDYTFLDLKEFQPEGSVEPTPKLLQKIDYLAKYDLFAYGYEITVTINGYKQRGVSNSTTSGTVIGGINKGENTIEMSIKKTDPNEKEIPFIGIRAYINDKEVDVFSFNEDLVGTSIIRTFTVK